jgi:hypothetical protein
VIVPVLSREQCDIAAGILHDLFAKRKARAHKTNAKTDNR